jgi:hypothetical protein
LSRWPVATFVALAIATVGAFFVTQHLKVTTPLIAGFPAPVPSAINPVDGGACRLRDPAGRLVPVSFRRTRVSFYLLHRADDVDVYVVNQDGTIVDQLASGRPMAIKVRQAFTWDGRESNGSVAPAGLYDIRVSLVHQGRTLLISNQNSGAVEPVTVETTPPMVRVTSVTAPGIAAGNPTVIPLAGVADVTIHYTGADGLRPQMLIYRTDLPGPPRLVKSYAATSAGGHSLWNGTLTGGAPAPQGTYLVGLMLTDRACTTARFPAMLPPAPGTTAHAGVTVRYLAAEPPMVATPAGGSAIVDVDARRHSYRWKLRRAGAPAVLRSGTSSAIALSVPLPAGAAGLYELSLQWGPHRTAVPLVASARGAAASHARVLVVLPALTWQGLNPVDDDGDGVPNVLTGSEPVRLQRPLVDGLPAGFPDEAALLAYLRRAGLSFDLTTDLGLLAGSGPGLSGHAGVVLAGTEEWLPPLLATSLSTYVEQGGHVLSLGIASMLRSVTVAGGQALDPTPARATDALLARPGAVVSTGGALVLVDRDALHIFSGTSQALGGYRSYQPISVTAPAAIASAAGVANGQSAIVGYRLGRGVVVDIGLPGFGSSLAASLDARQLVGSVWRVLSR